MSARGTASENASTSQETGRIFIPLDDPKTKRLLSCQLSETRCGGGEWLAGRQTVREREKEKVQKIEKTSVLSWERIGIYRVNNRGFGGKKKKKTMPTRLGEGVGGVSERKWRPRLSSAFKRIWESSPRAFVYGFRRRFVLVASKAANSAASNPPSLKTKTKTRLTRVPHPPSLPGKVIIRHPLEISSQESRPGILLDFCSDDDGLLMIPCIYVYMLPRRGRGFG